MTMWRCLQSSARAREVLADPEALRRAVAILLQQVADPEVLAARVGPEALVLPLNRSHQSRSA
jgi:hypothetical protein